MIHLQLAIRFHRSICREPQAWFVPGSRPAIWCDELLRWDVRQSELRLYAVPHSRTNRKPRGVLVTVVGGDLPSASPRCQAYGCIQDRLFLPVDAQLDPDLTEEQLNELLPPIEGRVYVFHPAAGLVGFEAAEELTLSQLISTPSIQTSDWDVAQPGLHVNQRIQSLRPIVQPDVETSLKEGGEDIALEASDPADLDKIPPTPEEGLIARLKWVLSGGKRAWNRSKAKRSRGRDAPNSTAAAFAAERSGSAASSAAGGSPQTSIPGLYSLRRLLHLLQTNPEMGLKYALPIGGRPRHRGLAPSSGVLWPRDVEFNLNDLNQSGTAEYWAVSMEEFHRLRVLYHKLAMREIQLGRHRRAAYIFAYLLDDLESAARTLENAHHWREAAKLYEKLQRPIDAANCLEKGGMLYEALEIWESQGYFERVAEIHTKLGQTDRAIEAWRKLVDQKLQQSDFVTAANVLSTKIGDIEEAIDVLQKGWELQTQAAECLRESFRLRDQLRDHDAAQRQILELRTARLSHGLSIIAVEQLSNVAYDYSDAATRKTAGDVTRVLAARCLPRSTPDEGARLLLAVRQLAPEDWLLQRDCSRFGDRLNQSRKPRSTRRRTEQLWLTNIIMLPPNVIWRSAFSLGSVLYAVGTSHERRLVIARARWDGTIQKFPLMGPVLTKSDSQIMFQMSHQGKPQLWLYVVGEDRIMPQKLPAAFGFDSPEILTPAWLPSDAVALAPGSCWCVRRSSHGLAVSYKTIILDSDIFTSIPTNDSPVAIHYQKPTVWVGHGHHVIAFGNEGTSARLDEVEPGDTILSLGNCEWEHRRVFYATTQQQVVVFHTGIVHGTPSPPTQEFSRTVLGRGFYRPIVSTIPGGWLAIASTSISRPVLEIYRFAEHGPQRQATTDEIPNDAMAILPTNERDRFALLFQSGLLQIYTIARY